MTIGEFVSQKSKEGKRVAYWHKEHEIVIIVDKERGYTRTGAITNDPSIPPPITFKTEKEAEDRVLKANEMLGISPGDALTMFFYSISPATQEVIFDEENNSIIIYSDGEQVLKLGWDDAKDLATKLKQLGVKPRRVKK